MRDLMAHLMLPDPQDASERFAKEQLLLWQEFSPTSQELRRMLGVKMSPANWHKVNRKRATTDVRRVHTD